MSFFAPVGKKQNRESEGDEEEHERAEEQEEREEVMEREPKQCRPNYNSYSVHVKGKL